MIILKILPLALRLQKYNLYLLFAQEENAKSSFPLGLNLDRWISQDCSGEKARLNFHSLPAVIVRWMNTSYQ